MLVLLYSVLWVETSFGSVTSEGYGNSKNDPSLGALLKMCLQCTANPFT